ncbi:hypothetical protein ETH_00006245 [Eimeria tenella]|uniref:Uncharacterized protein n=1 Tax=Eimeria tenella TaxID=5802 RepID=U6KVC2_EIMTE|nr:hypothetical protein ETH_00006245 [Eimeria tenella]CDJ40888.1 hypothetical protein ETH_00006245 [Eimeria tenella]|eukprot:XP_013231638.1 hypothetical protein ETH_00006245 [Eimeria tenella]
MDQSSGVVSPFCEDNVLKKSSKLCQMADVSSSSNKRLFVARLVGCTYSCAPQRVLHKEFIAALQQTGQQQQQQQQFDWITSRVETPICITAMSMRCDCGLGFFFSVLFSPSAAAAAAKEQQQQQQQIRKQIEQALSSSCCRPRRPDRK